MIVDTHTHVVSHDEAVYPLGATELPNGTWWQDDRCDVDELIAAMDAASVDAAVLVQPSGPYSFDNRYLVDAHARHPRRSAAICTLDIDAAPERAALEIDELVRTSGVGGLRLFALDFSGGEGWIGDQRTAPVWEQLDQFGIPAVPTVFAHQLPALARMLERFPHVTACLDHCAFPDLSDDPAAALEPLIALAALPNLLLKVSTFVLTAGPPDAVAAALEELRTHFGASRMMWGSDYPQSHDRSYPELVELAASATAAWPDVDREAFLGGTALTVWPSLAAAG